MTDSLYNVSKYMLIAEHSVKSPLAYHFKEIYGENQQEYLALTHYTVTKANQKNIQQLIQILSYHLTHKSDYAYITHYKMQIVQTHNSRVLSPVIIYY